MGFVSLAPTALGSGTVENCTSVTINTNIYCKSYANMKTATCPLPTLSTIDYHNGTVVNDNRGAYYQCYFNISGEVFQVNIGYYNSTIFSTIPNGWLTYVGQTITDLADVLFGVGSLFVAFISPLGFNIFGYGIGDLAGIGLAFVITLYALSYAFITAMIYKIFSPFVGSGG